jgi:hypothetical protein
MVLRGSAGMSGVLPCAMALARTSRNSSAVVATVAAGASIAASILRRAASINSSTLSCATPRRSKRLAA